MNERIDLADGPLGNTDRLHVELIRAPGEPPMVAINWPQHPTVSTAAHYGDVAATAMRLLANASTELSRLKAAKKL